VCVCACRWGLDHPFAGNYQQRLAQVSYALGQLVKATTAGASDSGIHVGGQHAQHDANGVFWFSTNCGHAWLYAPRYAQHLPPAMVCQHLDVWAMLLASVCLSYECLDVSTPPPHTHTHTPHPVKPHPCPPPTSVCPSTPGPQHPTSPPPRSGCLVRPTTTCCWTAGEH
jgi:hypothetical protein